jgi:hypothetical protein
MLTTTILAAAEEPTRGWGGPIALAVAVGTWYVFISVFHRVQEARGGRRTDPSPTPPAGRGVSDTTQVRAVSDTADTARDTGWWGRIATVAGKRVRVIEGTAEPVDEEVDVALDDDEDERETEEDVVDRLDRRGVQYHEIVSTLMADFRISESTAKRRIRDARAARAEV